MYRPWIKGVFFTTLPPLRPPHSAPPPSRTSTPPFPAPITWTVLPRDGRPRISRINVSPFLKIRAHSRSFANTHTSQCPRFLPSAKPKNSENPKFRPFPAWRLPADFAKRKANPSSLRGNGHLARSNRPRFPAPPADQLRITRMNTNGRRPLLSRRAGAKRAQRNKDWLTPAACFNAEEAEAQEAQRAAAWRD